MICSFCVSCFILKVPSPHISCDSLHVSFSPAIFISPLDCNTCVWLLVLPSIALTWAPLPSCIKTPCCLLLLSLHGGFRSVDFGSSWTSLRGCLVCLVSVVCFFVKVCFTFVLVMVVSSRLPCLFCRVKSLGFRFLFVFPTEVTLSLVFVYYVESIIFLLCNTELSAFQVLPPATSAHPRDTCNTFSNCFVSKATWDIFNMNSWVQSVLNCTNSS